MFPLFEFFGRTVGTYSVLSIGGLLVSGGAACFLGKRRRIGAADIVLMMLAVVAGVLIGGHLLYGLTHGKEIMQAVSALGREPFWDVVGWLAACFGGMVFYGGFLGSVAAVMIYTHFAKTLHRPTVLDILAVATPLFHTFGRIGCFLGGCCYGVESDWGFLVHSNPLQPEMAGVVRFPVQLIEAGCNLAIFGFLLFLFWRGKYIGKLLQIYILVYAPIRFCLEFYRGDEIRGIWFGLSTSQWISLLLLIFVIVSFLIRWIRRTPYINRSPNIESSD